MLPAETFRQVRRIHIRTRRLVDGALAGEYHSVFKGRGMEFAEVHTSSATTCARSTGT